MDFTSRREKLRKLVKKTGADALLVTSFVNVTYLTGFTGDDSYLLIRPDGETIISDGRYVTQLEGECPDLAMEIRRPGISILESVVRLVRACRIGRLAIEGDAMTVTNRDKLASELPKVQLGATSGLVESLRQIKDRDEIEEIRQAVWYAEKAFGAVRASLRPEQTEKQISDELEHQFHLFGARTFAFPPIVAVGARGALPHATPGPAMLAEGDFVLIDWGAQSRLYKSDLTRVLVTGRISPKLRRVYEVVLSAQARAIDAIRPGAAAKDIDAAARGAIGDAGFGRSFNHGMGHGVGLEIHEAPRLSATASLVLEPGMVITIEPGIYLPGWGGVRIEDDVLVTRSGHEVLTSVPKRLEEMIVSS
jgi:Xaa-Pro aminopeptidase